MDRQAVASGLRLAASTEFAAWQTEACVVDFGLGWTPPSNVVSKFNNLSTVQLPSDLAHHKLDKSRDSEAFALFLRDLQNWSKDQGGPEKTSQDRSRIASRLHDLFRVFTEIRYHWSLANSDDVMMHSVDALLDMVFNDVPYTEYRLGQMLRLCQSDRVDAVRTQADRLLTIQCPELGSTLVKEAKLEGVNLSSAILEEATWEDLGAFRSIIALPMEYRRREHPFNVAPSQLVLDLATAQNQRRALGLPARVLYGMVYHDGALRVFSASWVNGLLHIYFHKAYMIVTQREFISAYCFLSKVREYVAELHDELESIDVPKALRSIQANRWRAQDRLGHPSPSLRGSDDADFTVEEVEEEYVDDSEDSTELRKSPVLIQPYNDPPKRLRPGDGPPSLVEMLKQWVKSFILYYLGVLAATVHEKLS